MEAAILIMCLSLTMVDGDTVKCDGTNLRPMGDGQPHVSGFDAPEVGGRAKCEKERALAELASARMAELLATPGLTIEDSGAIDRYRRPLVVLRLPDGSTIGQTLINEGLAREWRPNSEIDWCD